MAITQFTTTPLGTEQNNFSNRMDTRILEQQTFVTEANALATEMNLYATFGAGAALALNGFKNKIIGGDFHTNPWQLGISFAAVNNGVYTADRWIYGKVGAAVHTISKAADSPSAVQAGIYSGFCLGLAVTTAQTTFAAGDNFTIGQKIEGINSASFGFGQAGSRFITKSFWVKAAKTGIHCVSFKNSALTRSYVAEYTITAANTWELKKITVPVDTSGTWLYDTGTGLTATFALAAGTTFQTTANTWQTGNFLTTANQVNELDTIGNNFKINLVQIEPGSIFTAFESQAASSVRAFCKRYYRKSYDANTDPGTATNNGAVSARRTITGEAATIFIETFEENMRATPSVVWYNPSTGASGSIYNATTAGTITVTGENANSPTSTRKIGAPTHASGATAGDIIIGHYTASAEL